MAKRLTIGFFGLTNAGKSSLINALTKQKTALVSPVAGTTTDPVRRSMELLPLGPVVLIDTAGLGDGGELGELRMKRTLEVTREIDLAIVVTDPFTGLGDLPDTLLPQLKNRPTIGVINKCDLAPRAATALADQQSRRLGFPWVAVSAHEGTGLGRLVETILTQAPRGEAAPPFLADLVSPGDLVLLVAPIDGAAPKGRLIKPQVQAIREVLDQGGLALTVQPAELPVALQSLSRPPSLVITDSQAFGQVDRLVPPEVPLTSFSTLMARHKGDLPTLVEGARALDRLRPGDRVLIAETCTHHQQPDDIGTVKIPRWLNQYVGGELVYDWAHGKDLPEDLSGYKVVIHCGGCMISRQLMISRLEAVGQAGLPVVNYGIAIAHLHGILKRALSPFHLEVS